MLSSKFFNEFDISSNRSLHSSSSSCSYQLQSVLSYTPEINASSNSFLETFGASNIWIMELRWHIESECSNILQSKVIPDGYQNVDQMIYKKPPLSLLADILEDRFGLIADSFQSIFRNSKAAKNELCFTTIKDKLSRITSIIYDMLSLMRGDYSRTEKEDHSILFDLTRIKLRVEKDLSSFDSRINLKGLLSNLIEYGKALANLKQLLIKYIFESFATFLRRQVRKRLIHNSSITNESMNEKQKNEFENTLNHTNNRINSRLSCVIVMIKKSHIYASVLTRSRCFTHLIKMCSFSYFKHSWLLALKLLTILCSNEDAILQFEKNNGIDILCNLMKNFAATEAVLAETARLIVQITFVKMPSLNKCSSLIDKIQQNLENLLNSLTMLCAITMSSSTFIVATVAINNLMILFPNASIFSLNPRVIQILVSACLSDKAFTNFAKDNVITIFAHLSENEDFEQVLIENNIIELSLKFLSDCIDENQSSIYCKNNDKTSSQYPDRRILRRFEFLICLFRIIFNLCCNERNIDLLVENNDIGNIYICHQELKSFKQDNTAVVDECLSILEYIIKNIESRINPHSSRTVQTFLKLNNSKESDV